VQEAGDVQLAGSCGGPHHDAGVLQDGGWHALGRRPAGTPGAQGLSAASICPALHLQTGIFIQCCRSTRKDNARC
jgi:hypothetical protein